RDSPAVDRLCELGWCRQAEVAWNGMFETRARSTPVLAACRGEDRCEANVVTAAPIARDRTERRKAGLPAVGCDADAVDPAPAHDRDAPDPLRSCPQHREGVVGDGDLGRKV